MPEAGQQLTVDSNTQSDTREDVDAVVILLLTILTCGTSGKRLPGVLHQIRYNRPRLWWQEQLTGVRVFAAPFIDPVETMRILVLTASIVLSAFLGSIVVANPPLRIALFQADATPPLGSPLCNGNVKPVMEIVSPLTARGVVLLGSGDPIVVCAFDWVGIGNGSYDQFRQAIAMAAYGDYGPGYIGTEIAYGQGGYETGRVSRVAPQVEAVLMDAMEQLLEVHQ